MKATNFIKAIVTLVSVAGFFALPAAVSAHYGDASATCEENVGVITANFHAFSDDLVNKNVKVSIDAKQVDSFTPPANDFVKTYKPYAVGNHTVVANWAIDGNHNGKADAGEEHSFTSVVTVPDTCKPKETPKCTVPGKETLPASDANCKVDKCEIAGKTDLAKSDAKCTPDKCVLAGKTDLLASDSKCTPDKCAVAGKTDLVATDANCKADTPQVLPAVTELPNTGAGTGAMVAVFAAVTVAGAIMHNKFLSRR